MAKVTADFDIVEETIRQLSPDKPNQGFDMVNGIPVPEDRSVARFEVDGPDFWADEDGGPSIGTLQMMDLYGGVMAQIAGPKNTFDRNQIKPPTAEEIANTSAEDLLAKTVRPEDAELILKSKIVEAGVTDPQAQDMILAKGMTAFTSGKSPTAVLNSAATGIEDFINDVLGRVNSVIGPIYTKGEDFLTEMIDKVTKKVPLAKVLIPNQGTVINAGTGQVTGTYTLGGKTPPWAQTGTGGFVLANPNAGGGILTSQRGPVSVSTGSPAADKILGAVLGADEISLKDITVESVIGEVAKQAGINPNVVGQAGKTVISTAKKVLNQIEDANNSKLTVELDPCDDPTSAAYNDPNLCPKNVTGGQDATKGQAAVLQNLTCWNANGESRDFNQVASCPDTFPFTSNPFDAGGAQATVPIEGKGEKPCEVVDGVQYVRDANGNCGPPVVNDKCNSAIYAAQNLCECYPNHPECVDDYDPCEELKGECAKLGQCADCTNKVCVACPAPTEEEEEEEEEVVEEESSSGGGGGGGFGLSTPPPISVAPPLVTEEQAELADVGPQYSISGKPLFKTQEVDDLDFLGLESNPFVPFNKGGIVKDYAINALIDILRNK